MNDEEIEQGGLKCIAQITFEDMRIPWKKVFLDFIDNPIDGSKEKIVGKIRKIFYDQNPTSKQLLIYPNE